MTTRRTFIAVSALAASAVPLRSILVQAAEEEAKQADFLFVQSAKGMTFDKATNKLTLTGVSPATIFFSDRPDRIAPWEELDEWSKEVDRRIGEAVARLVLAR